MNYFKFDIPKNADGTRVSYSPGWHGTYDQCPANVVVDLYNDDEGYGIAHTESSIPIGIKVIDSKEAVSLIEANKTDSDKGIFVGEAIMDRLDWNPEATIENKVDADATVLESQVIERKAQFCPVCHQFIMYLPENIKAKKILVTCPVGHKVVIYGR